MADQVNQASLASATRVRLTCRLRKRVTERAARRATAGEVELENVSGDVLEIEIQRSYLEHLELIVTDASGRVMSEWPYSDIFSPMEETYLWQLQPGEKFVHPVGFTSNVPREKLRPGDYTVQAVYEYKDLRAVSEPYHLHLGPEDL